MIDFLSQKTLNLWKRDAFDELSKTDAKNNNKQKLNAEKIILLIEALESERSAIAEIYREQIEKLRLQQEYEDQCG